MNPHVPQKLPGVKKKPGSFCASVIRNRRLLFVLELYRRNSSKKRKFMRFQYFRKNLKKGVDSWRKMSYIVWLSRRIASQTETIQIYFRKNKKVVDK